MFIEKNQMIGGSDARKLRGFLRWLGDAEAEPETIEKRLGEPPNMEMLLASEVIEPSPHGDGYYRIGNAGWRIANASLFPPMPKTKAISLVRALFDRILAANNGAAYLYFVKEMRLFGSVIDPNKTECSDIDIALDLGRREVKGDWIKSLLAESEGLGLPYLQRLAFPQIQLRRFLKARNHRLSFHNIDEPETLGVKSLSIYPKRELEF